MKQLDRKAIILFFIQNIFVYGFVLFIFIILVVPFLPSYTYNFDASNFKNAYEKLMIDLMYVGPFFLLFCYIWAVLTYHFYRYELSEIGFKKESGVLYKRYVTIPYNKIQNIDIHQGVLARLLNISDLKIQTAGSTTVSNVYGDAEGILPGISMVEAQNLRDKLVELSKK